MEEENIKKDYLAGATYKEICKKHSIKPNQLKYLIKKNKWKRKSNRSKAQKGNKNAVGNKGGHAPKGNQNAVTTGEYANILNAGLTKEEADFFNNYVIEDEKSILMQELKTLMIRKKRMLNRIEELKSKHRDMTVNKIHKDNNGTSTEVIHTLHFITKLEESLTRIQENIRRNIDSLHRIENDNRKLELDIIRLEIEAARDNETPEKEDIHDDSFIKALEDTTEQVWEDYEEEENANKQESEKV